MKELKETHQTGLISIENLPEEFYQRYVRGNFNAVSMEGDLGVQIAPDGRVWLCIDGVAFLRFKPMATRAMDELVMWFKAQQLATKSMTMPLEEFDKKYKQLFGRRPLWYSWHSFYRDHGRAGLRADR